MNPGKFLNERKRMKNPAVILGLTLVCLVRAVLIGSIWCGVVGLLAIIGLARMLWTWRNRGWQGV